VARSFDAGRYNLAGPLVLGFVLSVCVLEQVFPAQCRPLPARGHLLDFCYAVDWLTHLANLRLTALWRLHAVHHSQEELSILTTYRAHPLVHVSFLLSAVPVLAVADNTTTPAVVLTACASTRTETR
jgi:Fatty acid hydroxylase superfamily